jgi:hypothetical protein
MIAIVDLVILAIIVGLAVSGIGALRAILKNRIPGFGEGAKFGSRSASAASPAQLKSLEDRVASLESRLEDRDQLVRKLQVEVNFVSSLLEDKSKDSESSGGAGCP